MAEDLVREVEKLGFRRKQDFEGPWRLMSALELGILLHIAKDYRDSYYGNYISRAWRLDSVPEEVELAQMHSYTGGVLSRALLDSVTNLAEKHLLEITKQKPEQQENVRQSRDLRLNNQILMEEVVGKLKVLLVVIEQGEEHSQVTYIEPKGELNIKLPVVLVVSASRVVLMEHGKFQEPVQNGFPCAMRIDEKEIACLKPLLENRPAEQLRVNTENYELAKYNVTAVLCNFLVQVLSEGVPSHLTQQHSEVCEVIQRFLQLQSMRGPLPVTADLQTVCDLSNLSHPISSCERVGSSDLMKLACGHYYHSHCIQDHIRSQAPTVFATPRPVFYCPAHRVPLTDRDLHQITPELIETLLAKRASSLIK